MNSTPKNILISRTDKIGDAVLTLPLVLAVRNNYPNAKIKILTRKYTRELYDYLECVDGVIEMPPKMNLLKSIKLIKEIKKENFDLAFLVYPRFLVAIVLKLSKIKNRVGTAYRWYSFLLNKKVYEHRKHSIKHEAEYNLSLLKSFNQKADLKIEFGLKTTKKDKATASDILKSFKIKNKKFVVLHPLSFGSSTVWPVENFIELAEKILSDLKLNVIFTGIKKEEDFVKSKFKDCKINFASNLKIMEQTALIEKSACFVSNSTGPMHFAAAIGTPVVSFFSPLQGTSPTRWGPIVKKKKIFVANNEICKLCRGGECKSNICMEQISVKSVLISIKELLNEK
ncbi:MAG: glycosyltransferase family 9 protein [Bacteroidota bacterium]